MSERQLSTLLAQEDHYLDAETGAVTPPTHLASEELAPCEKMGTMPLTVGERRALTLHQDW